MFYSKLSLLLLPALGALAAPLRLAPVKRATDIPGAKAYAKDAVIVSIKPNTVDPEARGEWLQSVLASADITISDDQLEAAKLGWSANIFNGLAATLDADAVKVLSAQKEVAWISDDIEMQISAIATQTNAPWGVSRLSNGAAPVVGDPLALTFQYTFDDSAGAGTDVYIIDTGILTTHVDFTGRAEFLASFGAGVPGQDLNGHGTHCAGSAAGSVFGIAKQASIFGVKVMADDGSGATSDIISGINVAANRAIQTGRPSVLSMSLGGPVNQAIDDAVANAIAGGVPFVVAAGNETQDANNVSPARLPEAITVGATDIDDNVAFFSNFGSAVDIFAPGLDILSAGFEANDAVSNLSGTSMATPQVAGLALTIMGLEGILTPAALQARLTELSVKGSVSGAEASGSVNELASNGINQAAI